jgi:hypothetical protein
MLAEMSGVPSTGQNPASFGYVRWHAGQLFMVSVHGPADDGIRDS